MTILALSSTLERQRFNSVGFVQAEGTELDTKEVLDRLPHLNALLQRLLRSNSFHEVELMAESLQHVGKLLPLTNRRILCDWGLSACSVGSGDDMVSPCRHPSAAALLVPIFGCPIFCRTDSVASNVPPYALRGPVH
jgi:hypothetical protein